MMEKAVSDKVLIREDIRKRKKEYTSEALLAFSNGIVRQIEVHPAFVNARTILAYWNLPDEPDLSPLLLKYEKEKEILLPVIEKGEIILARFTGEDCLCRGAYSIREPRKENRSGDRKIDLALIPGVAFDERGNRLGRGKGFYDKFLSTASMRKFGICFPFQVVGEIPVDAWDVPMDAIIY